MGADSQCKTDNEDGSTIWIYELSEDTQIRPLAGEGNNRHPIWTPDGERVTFASDRDGNLEHLLAACRWERCG